MRETSMRESLYLYGDRLVKKKLEFSERWNREKACVKRNLYQKTCRYIREEINSKTVKREIMCVERY